MPLSWLRARSGPAAQLQARGQGSFPRGANHTSMHTRAGLDVFQALAPHQLELMALYQNEMTRNSVVFDPAGCFQKVQDGKL